MPLLWPPFRTCRSRRRSTTSSGSRRRSCPRSTPCNSQRGVGGGGSTRPWRSWSRAPTAQKFLGRAGRPRVRLGRRARSCGTTTSPRYTTPIYATKFDDVVLRPMVDLLTELAGDGPALEFAVGTGRVALPLSKRGIPVSAIELSPHMADRLRAKPGADAVPVTIGDMTTTRVPGTFALVYLVANTIMNVTTQDEQVSVFANAAAHLHPGGCFVVELIVPQLRAVPRGERGRVFTLEADHVGVETLRRSGRPDRLVASLDGGGRPPRPTLCAVPVRVAFRARPDGAPRRPAPPQPLGRLGACTVHL